MRLENNEYIVSKAGVPDESITITKEALEKWRDHYADLAHRRDKDNPLRELLYLGKYSVLADLLKHFEEEGA